MNARPNATSPAVPVLGFWRPHDPNLGSIDFVGEKTMTHQSFKDECDINLLMAQYSKTGVINHLMRFQGQYGDFSEVADFQTAQHIVLDAQAMFLTLPSKIRAQFNNDPGQFLDFATNPENAKALIDMGLATAPKDPAAPPVEQAAPPAAPAPLTGAPAPSPVPKPA